MKRSMAKTFKLQGIAEMVTQLKDHAAVPMLQRLLHIETYEALGLFLRRMLKSKKAADIVTVNSVLKDTMAVLSKDEAASGHQDGTEFAATSQLFTTAAVPPSTAVHVANPMDCKREEILSNDVAASASQMKKVILHPSDAEQKFSSIDGVCKREATSESEGIIAAVALLPENVPVQDTPTSQLVERTAGPSSEVYRNTDPLDRVCKTMTSSSSWSCPECARVILKRNLWSHLKFVHQRDAEEIRQSREQINREAGVAHIVCPVCGEHFATYEGLARHCQDSHLEDGAAGHPQNYEVFSLQFGSKQEYEVWLQERCEATSTSFFISRSRETAATERKQKLL
ncbi:unnamed protein product [Heligmosomoides polygyrus]|uniref:C2H2-type domain-containing protein n=1 Tax=Heligmosomoides polygyrus TaxID=6339 RepID=A0A3P7YFH5_HELPZ|nr:unnamed protein product [Heligmosomoides polygyrus]